MKQTKAILVVSFGTTHTDTMAKTISAIEESLAAAFPDRALYRAFTSGIVIRRLAEQGIHVDTVAQALERIAADGITDLLIQSTHILMGEEWEKLLQSIAGQVPQTCTVGLPLLSGPSDQADTARILLEQLPPFAADRAIVLMGHGSAHPANSVYAELEARLHELGRRDILMGTVEGTPDVEAVCQRLKQQPVSRILCCPFMIVAGDHAKNDLAGPEPSSWASRFAAMGYSVETRLEGLGECASIRDLFAAHAKAARSL